MKTIAADRAMGDVAAVEERLYRPARKAGEAASARDELEDRNGEHGGAAFGFDSGRSKDLAHKVEAVVGDGIGDKRLLREILRREIILSSEG